MPAFHLSRTARVLADPDQIRPLVDDLRAWREWSPWEGLDPELRRTYSGPDSGAGATYAWAGNRRAGEGRMEVVESTPTAVVIDLRFLKPFKATNETRFDFAPAADGTAVTWTMTGRRNPVMSVLGRLFFDQAIGRDFDRGLVALKAAAESGRDQDPAPGAG